MAGERETLWFFNLNVAKTDIIYDYFESNNYLTFGPSLNIETTDPAFSVLNNKFLFNCFLLDITRIDILKRFCYLCNY